MNRINKIVFVVCLFVFFSSVTASADDTIQKKVGDTFRLEGVSTGFLGHPSYNWTISDTSVVIAKFDTSGMDTCSFKAVGVGTCRIQLISYFYYNNGTLNTDVFTK